MEKAHASSRAAVALLLALLLASGSATASPALLRAAAVGDLPGVRAELAGGADINFTAPNRQPKYGYLVQTALEKAAVGGHREVAALLLGQDATLRADRWYGLYAATWAGQAGQREVLELLLQHARATGAKLNDLFGPALINAARNGRAESVELLLDRGVSPNWHTPGDHFPRPAVLEAPRSGQMAIFATLLDSGGDPRPYPEILTHAAMRGDPALVTRLLELGMAAGDGAEAGPPLAMAACMSTGSNGDYRQGINATVAVLLAAGAEVNASARGRSPLFCAHEDGNAELIAMLEAKGAKSFETAGRKLKRLGWQALFGLGGH